MFVFTCVLRLRARERETIIYTETLRTEGVDKKVNQTSEIKTGNIIPEKGTEKLISSVTSDLIEEPIRGYSIRAFEAIARGLLGIATDHCAVKKINNNNNDENSSVEYTSLRLNYQ
ncbi:unnamed protein product [Arctogadus glacialis]